MLVAPELYELLEAVNVLHFNAGCPDALGGNASPLLRAWDPDPLEEQFTFQRSGRGRGRGQQAAVTRTAVRVEDAG